MLRRIKRIFKRLLGIHSDPSGEFVEYLRSLGCKIGQRTFFYAPNSTMVDVSRPWMIDIGDDVQITYGCRILTHGYDWSVLKGKYGDVLGSSGKVTIGNNVFIGMNTTILKGVHIGNNVIIGADSLVNTDLPDDCVAVGSPCRPIMTLEEYYQKRLDAQEAEAAELVHTYRERFHQDPPEEALSEFFWLFSDGETPLHPSWKEKMALVGTERLSYEKLSGNQKKYENYQDFLKHI